jgi:DNA-directed RNA polymerase specialized sigma24 family protein
VSIEILIFLVFAVILVLLVVYLYYRDKGLIKRLELYEVAIDDLNSRLYDVEQKSVVSLSSSHQDHDIDVTEFSKHLSKVEEELTNRLDDMSDPLLKTIRAIKDMEVEIKRIDDRVNSRISKLEESAKLASMSSGAKLINEKAIVALYKEGYSAEEIAKTERTPIGEVELILRIANLR